MKIYDATRILSEETYVYPGDPPVSFSFSEEGGIRVSEIRMGSHSGTHIDAPLHYFSDGASVDEIPLEACVGPCSVKSVYPGSVQSDLFLDLPADMKRLLIRSGWSESDPSDYGCLTKRDALTLVERGIKAVGTDAPSIESYNGDGSVHRTLLSAGVVIIESLSLSEIPEGKYMMVALPIACKGIDGSPARVILCNFDCVIS
ncbi:MAG: cyclase family protein [Methanocalculus sp.]|nr:cyclase family protein [Methanocalculus sp.]MDO8841341.1 cyclase family protein [Methanocalculus sp.]MDO9539651.1 cyclase family protein [Methanocalculus sp.]